MNLTRLQNLTDQIGRQTWQVLEEVFGCHGRPIPPLYFFLSPRSRNSLRGRNSEEIDLVHRQQFYGEGITLKNPPAAWVSFISQIPEETAHLFALTYQPSTRRQKNSEALSEKMELWSMTLHEAFGKFASLLSLPEKEFVQKKSRPQRNAKNLSPQKLWKESHRQGYALGHTLAQSYFSEKTSIAELRKWFRQPWYSSSRKPPALIWLQSLKNPAA